MLNSDNTWCRS